MYTIFRLSAEINEAVRRMTHLASEKLYALQKNGICPGFPTPRVLFSDLTERKQLGFYDLSSNTMVLSDDLVGLPDEMQNVMLHELAHAVDFSVNGNSAHDGAFHRICDVLGVDPDFSGAVAKQSIEKREVRRDKIRKLLNLGSSSFASEAESAILKARELIEKWGVDEEDDKDEIWAVEVTDEKRKTSWISHLGYAVAMITGAYPLFMHGAHLTFYGSRDQVEAAMYIWDALCQTIGLRTAEIVKRMRTPKAGPLLSSNAQPELFGEWLDLVQYEEQEKKRLQSVRIERNQIRDGIVLGFQKKLKEGSCRTMTVRSSSNEAKLKRITSVRPVSVHLGCRRGSAFRSGYEEGEKMDIPERQAQVRRICAA